MDEPDFREGHWRNALSESAPRGLLGERDGFSRADDETSGRFAEFWLAIREIAAICGPVAVTRTPTFARLPRARCRPRRASSTLREGSDCLILERERMAKQERR